METGSGNLHAESEEPELKIHPLRQASVYIFAPLILMDTFLLIFTAALLAEGLGADEATIGIIAAINPAFNLIFELPWGWFSDKRGRRLPLILGGIFIVPGLIGFALATEPWHLMVAQAFRGIGGAAGIPLSKALIADLAPRKVLGERMGAWTMTATAAPLVGFAISGILFDIDKNLPFLVAAATEFTCVLLAIFAIPETIAKRKSKKTKEKKERGKEIKDYFKILRRRGVALSSFSIMMAHLGGNAAAALAFPLFAATLGLSGTQIGLVYTLGLVILVIGSVPGGSFSDRFGRKWPVIIAGFWSALMWPLYPYMVTVFIPFLGFMIMEMVTSIGSAFGGPAFTAYLYEWVLPHERGRASAITEAARDVGTVAGYPLVGAIYLLIGAEWAFYFAAIVGGIAYIIILAFWKKAPPLEELRK